MWFRRTTKLCSSKNGHSKNRNSFSQWHSEFRSIIPLFAISVESATKKNLTLFLRQFSHWRRICLSLNRNSHSSNRIIGFPTKTNSEFVPLTLFGKCAEEETLWQPKRTHWDSLFHWTVQKSKWFLLWRNKCFYFVLFLLCNWNHLKHCNHHRIHQVKFRFICRRASLKSLSHHRCLCILHFTSNKGQCTLCKSELHLAKFVRNIRDIRKCHIIHSLHQCCWSNQEHIHHSDYPNYDIRYN